MKIIHIITGLKNGGAEAVMLRLIVSDIRSGNRHYVISLTDRDFHADNLERAGIEVHALGFRRGSFTLAKIKKLYGLIRQIKPDVVQTWMYHADLVGGVVARLAGISAICWGIRHANHDPEHNSKGTLRVVRLCARLSGWVPRKIVTCSEEAMRLHKAAGYQADKFVQIPNGYNMDRLKPDVVNRNALRAELKIATDSLVLGMVARFDVQKDHGNLIKALGLIKDRGINFTCLLIGVDINESNDILCAWIEEAKISKNIRLLGPRGDIPALMNAIDIHVLSSLGEAFPNVLAEAMACGTPCVTTNVGDAAFIVGEHGWVVAPQDPEALAEGLLQACEIFLSDASEWKRLQALCRARIMANFELELMCSRYRQVWKTCIHA